MSIYFQNEENNQYETTLSIPIIRNFNGVMIVQPEYNQDVVPPTHTIQGSPIETRFLGISKTSKKCKQPYIHLITWLFTP